MTTEDPPGQPQRRPDDPQADHTDQPSGEADDAPRDEPHGARPDQDDSPVAGIVRVDDHDPGADDDPSDARTVDLNIDQTIAVDLSAEAKRRPTVRSGSTDRPEGTDNGSDGPRPPAKPTIRADPAAGSILDSPKIDATVNPRELPERDAALWNSAVGQDSDPSVLPPAIQRTFADSHLGRLRRCDVAAVKSDEKKALDYRLLQKLGHGGMGDVFLARQNSLDRDLALKLIKPLTGKKRAQLVRTGRLETVEEERKQQFLTEAIITGDLDHPNIVPIHDVALTSNNELFYSMKRVTGDPWSDVIGNNTRDENLDILLKVADAIAFAHSRGVVHRDIKPENIMIGGFGEVMVMDWGLALPTSQREKQDSIFATSGLGGTPAFMAPEMATGPLRKIGPAADIYLLGATLFMIITGRAPHQGKNVTECLKAVRNNTIRDVPEDLRGELLDIALKAMATRPQDRFANVPEFQRALRDYRAHEESISLAARAESNLRLAEERGNYEDYARATVQFEDAIQSWHQNQRARQGLAATKIAHARAAYQKGDFDLGLTLIDRDDPEHRPIRKQLRIARDERDSRARRLRGLRKVAAAMLAIILVGGSVAIYLINQKKQEAQIAWAEAEEQRTVAEQQRIEAEKQRAVAESQRSEAETQRDIAKNALKKEQEALRKEQVAKQREMDAKDAALAAEKRAKDAAEEERLAKEQTLKALMEVEIARANEEKAREEAESQRDEAHRQRELADTQRQRAEYEEYASKIALAKARLQRNEADSARQILQEVRSRASENWEWRWLWQQANQSESDVQAETAVIDQSLGSLGRRAAVALRDGRVQVFGLSDQGELTEGTTLTLPRGQRATAVAIAPGERYVAIGTRTGGIMLYDFDTQRFSQLPAAHRPDRPISDLQFSRDDLLVSGSMDKTVRLWDPRQRLELSGGQPCWHISPVRQVALAGTQSSLVLAVAVSDEVTGRVAIWETSGSGDTWRLERRGTLTQHDSPVASVAISPDGRTVASGDQAGNVLLWDRASVKPIDYGRSIKQALAKLDGQPVPETADAAAQPASRLADVTETGLRLVSSGLTLPPPHDGVVQSLQFSGDGKSLLSGSGDYTLKLWDVTSQTVRKILRGHGGWVVAGEFLRGRDDVIVSASGDGSVRTWRPAGYTGALVRFTIASEGAVTDAADLDHGNPPRSTSRRRQAHDDPIWSASFSSAGTRVVTASHDHTARVLQIDRQTLAFRQLARLDDRRLQEGTAFVAMSMHLDPRHGRLFIGSADSTIRIWDLNLGTQICEATGTGLNSSFAISPDGRLLLTGSSTPEAKAKLWEIDPTGTRPPQLIRSLAGHEEAITAFAISPDSSLLFTGDRGGYGILWDAISGERLGSAVEEFRGYRINDARFSADGRHLLVGCDDTQLTILDVQSRRPVARLNHDGFVTQVALSPNRPCALTVSELSSQQQIRTTAVLWDLTTGRGRVLEEQIQNRTPGSAQTAPQRITSAQFDPSGQTAWVVRSASDSRPSSIGVWNVDRVGREPGTSSTPLSASTVPPERQFDLPPVVGTAQAVLPVADGMLLTMNQNAVFRWDLETGQLQKSYRAHVELTEASFSSDGKYVATASRSVKIWDASTGKALAKLESTRPIRSVQFAPTGPKDGQYGIATGGDEGVARIWRWDSSTGEIGQQVPMCDAGGRIIRRVRFSPGGDRLVIVGDAGLASLWDPRSPQSTIELDVPSDARLLSAAFSEQGEWLALGSSDRLVRLWHRDKLKDQPIELRGHAEQVNDVAIFATVDESRTGSLRVVTASSDDSVKVWDPRIGAVDEDGNHPGGREIISLRRHQGDVTSVDVTDRGEILMTAGVDGSVILWPASAPRNLFEQ